MLDASAIWVARRVCSCRAAAESASPLTLPPGAKRTNNKETAAMLSSTLKTTKGRKGGERCALTGGGAEGFNSPILATDPLLDKGPIPSRNCGSSQPEFKHW